MVDSIIKLQTEKAFKFHTNPETLQNYIHYIKMVIKNREQTYFFHHNLHTLYLYFRDPSIRRLYRDAVVMIDGMPIIGLLRLAGIPAKRHHRVTWVDFIWPLLDCANENDWRVFYLGNSQDILDTGLAHIKQRFPDLTIQGHHGYYDDAPGSAENQRIVDQINNFGADMCLVGMGTPRQERWVVQNRALLDVPAILVSGACLEYVSGSVQTPPRWLGRIGLEWSYRLIENPRRFAYRYFVEPWALAVMLMSSSLKKSNH